MLILIREDTEETALVLRGIGRWSHDHPGVVTDRALSDRSTRADGRLIRPRRLSLSGQIADLAGDGLLGEARVAEVLEELRDLQVDGVILSVTIPGVPSVPAMTVESYRASSTGQSPNIAIELKEFRTASTRTIQLAASSASEGGPTEQYAPGQDPGEERGEVATQPVSVGAAALDTLGGILGVGP